MGRPKRKYVLFLVEGYTDKEVLAGPISSMYEKACGEAENAIIEFCTPKQDDKFGGDITSSNGVNPENIEGLINKLYIDPFLEKNTHIYPKEISEIIHIVDLDGAFVDSEAVIKMTKEGANRISYTETNIETVDVEAIRCRNERKSANLRKLTSMNEIVLRHKNGRNTKTVKYSVYYFSCNMDHVIHGRLNLTTQEKVALADDFSVLCLDSPETFEKTVCSDEVAAGGLTYEESWEYVMRGNNSLERKTNLNILIEKLH